MFKNHPFIIAEIASAHEGRINNLNKIIKHALNAKPDAIKLQIFDCDSLVSKKNPQYRKLKKLEISQNNWRKVFKNYKKNTFLIAEAFDEKSLKFSIKSKKPVILAIGGSTFKEVKIAVKKLRKNIPNLVIMAGFQNFPTKIIDTKLDQINNIKKSFNTIIGYSDHVDATKKIESFSIPAMAYSLGANVIEKHITLNRSKKGTDYYSSLNPKEFINFVSFLKGCKFALKNQSWKLSKAEFKYRAFNKTFAITSKNLSKGHKINFSDISFKRTNKVGLTSREIKKYLGKGLKKNKYFEEMLIKKDF